MARRSRRDKRYLPYDFKEGKFNFDGYKPLIETASKFFTNNSVFPGSTSQGVDAMRAQFVEGTFGIWGNASQEAGVFTSQFPIDKFEWGVAEVPSLDGTRKGAQAIKPQKGWSYTFVSSSAFLERFLSNMESSTIKTLARSSKSSGTMASLMIRLERTVVKRIQLIWTIFMKR